VFRETAVLQKNWRTCSLLRAAHSSGKGGPWASLALLASHHCSMTLLMVLSPFPTERPRCFWFKSVDLR